ncbi:MAG: S8 family serine peptidase, partial [Pirellulaceae bacterium]|nr:S8 family serine peptidase [Pirellulaceae bacterium]
MRHFQPGVALLMIVTWTATAAGQSKQEVDGALDKAVETSQAAKKAQMAADDAKADAKKKQTELDMLKDQKKKLEEKLDQSMTISRLEKEIEELKKKLEIIDKVAQKVINGMINPGTKTTYTPDEQAVRTEALGGNTVPTVPDSIRKVFADKKAELEKQLKEKTEQLEKAKKDADKKLTDDERKDAQGQVAALDEKIKAKEAELAAAKAKATAAATAAKTAKEADQAAYAEFDKLRKAKKKEDDIAQAKKELEEALKGLRVASQSLKDRERELTQNLSIPGAVANLFRFIDDLLNVFGKISDALSVIKIDTNFNNPDLTNALSQGAKALDALEKILKDPKSTISRLIQLQLEDYYKNLKKWLNKVKAAKRKLEQLTAAGQGAKKLAMAPGKRRTMLKSPYLALTKNTATQLYAATEHALDRGSMEELSRIEASVGEYRDDALNGGNGFDQIDVSQSTMLANLIDEVQAHHASLAEQVAGIEGGVLPQTDLSELNSASHPHFSSGLRSITWEAFGDDLLRQRTAMTTAGAVVLKGNATSTMGAGPPTLTLSLSPRADDGGPEKTVNVEVADNGEFEVEIAPGWNPTQIRLGGPNTSTTILDDPLGAGLPGLPPWRNPALPPDAQRNVLLTFDRFERIVSTTLTGQAPRNGPPNEAAAIRGWRILGVVRGGDPPLDQMPNLEIWLNNTALDESLFADLADAVDENQVVNLNNNTPAVTAVSDAPPGGGETVTLVPFSGDLSTKPTTLSPIAERVTVIQQVAVLEDSEEMADALDLVAQQTLQKVRDHVQNVVGAGGKVVVTEVDRQNNQAPKSLTGDASFTFQINATNATGAPQPIDRGALQANLDGDDSLLAAGVALPREAQAAPADPYFKSKGSWGEEYHDQWALRRAGFVTPAGAGVWPEKLTPCTVAVIGGGVDWTHSDLAGQMWINEAEDPYNGIDDDNNGYVDDVFGWNFRDETNNVLDLGGHDTHIAGVIAARWNGRAMAGANPSARI